LGRFYSIRADRGRQAARIKVKIFNNIFVNRFVVVFPPHKIFLLPPSACTKSKSAEA
jgi:hypothetical protein